MTVIKKRSVLNDHKQVGKVLIPPFNQLFNLQADSWVDDFIPEVIWIALLNDYYGYPFAARLVIALSKYSFQYINSHNLICSALLTNHILLSNEEKKEIYINIEKDRLLTYFEVGLSIFHKIFPQNPISYLNGIETTTVPLKSEIVKYKSILWKLYDKNSVESVFTAYNVFLALSHCIKINLVSGGPMSNIEDIHFYPNTLESKLVASGIRAMLKTLNIHPNKLKDKDWSNYFWQTGYKLEPSRI